MIISRLIGGLGNQMFQYAAAKALSLKFKKKLYLDITCYNSYSFHQGYQLDKIFEGEFQVASTRQVENFLSPFYIKSLNFFTERQPFIKFSNKFIAEPSLEFYPNIFDIDKDYYLSGYWQSENYFKKIENVIRNDFKFKPFSDFNNIKLSEKIQRYENSVSIHIRRGDYLKSKMHRIIPLNYYKIAIDYLNDRFNNLNFFVFSDDIGWAYNNLKLHSLNVSYVSHNIKDYSFNDMFLMSLCRHNIIANSSFSWWGAWLGNNYKKGVVISPKNWFSTHQQPKSLIPCGWITF